MTTPYRSPASAAAEPAPRAIHYAHSLELALPTDLLALDTQGNVRAPSRMQRARYALPPALFFIFAALSAIGAFLVPVSAFRAVCIFVALVYLFVGAVYVWGRRAVRAARLLAQAKLDEAKQLSEGLLRHHILAAAFQSGAHLCLARIGERRGAHAAALEHFRAIRYRRAAAAARSPERLNHVREQAFFGEVIALCNLGREGEARALLADGPQVRGDYLRLLAQTATLYVELCEGTSKVPEAELASIVAAAARMATSWDLLPLAAWHLDARGDADGAAKLLALAATLPRAVAMAETKPRLWAWVSRGAPSP